MNILHLGGFRPVVQTIASGQAARGHRVQAALLSSRSGIFQLQIGDIGPLKDYIDAGFYDVIHVHSLHLIRRTEPGDLLKELLISSAQKGVAIFYSIYREDCMLLQDSLSALNEINTYGKLMLLPSSSDYYLSPLEDIRTSFMPVPIDLSAVGPARGFEPESHSLSVLHIPIYVSSKDTETIDLVCKRLQERGRKFNFNIINPSDITNLAEFRKFIREADLVIESLSYAGFGIVAVEAMAHGKTVISGNDVKLRHAFGPLALCPVIDSTKGDFEEMLDSIIREPKCLRDLGTRSRTYIDSYHDAELVVADTLSLYNSYTSPSPVRAG
ncbi:MAG: glycosyltransferase family 1 protein [Candidatus Dadabacteria bacterium]|nr:MAG: glycosyltransferase family 1 protein [Candidatus Dadabacteria bacterium]